MPGKVRIGKDDQAKMRGKGNAKIQKGGDLLSQTNPKDSQRDRIVSRLNDLAKISTKEQVEEALNYLKYLRSKE